MHFTAEYTDSGTYRSEVTREADLAAVLAMICAVRTGDKIVLVRTA